ncbi:MAG: hypothetical protein OXI60_01630 [Acidiferrobacterales bacterium]|nr:hypothetical protein [Acidiferrobacterales bacterium]
MKPARKACFSTLALLAALVLCPPAAGQISPYVYVQMSLGVPWFLYFVFLACILLPFFVLIALAWRRYYSAAKQSRDKHGNLEDY